MRICFHEPLRGEMGNNRFIDLDNPGTEVDLEALLGRIIIGYGETEGEEKKPFLQLSDFNIPEPPAKSGRTRGPNPYPT